MKNPASITDLEDRWRPLETAELRVATTRLNDAWSLLLSLRPGLPAQIGDDSVGLGSVVRVVADVALRVLKNPDGMRQEALDDYSGTRDDSVASGALYVTPSELADITPGRRTVRSVGLVTSLTKPRHG